MFFSSSGRNICASNRVCGTNSLPCTEINPCQGNVKCQNELNKTLVEDTEELKKFLLKILFLSECVTRKCTGDTMCLENCMCQSDGLTCTVIYPCEGKGKCHNSLSHIIYGGK